MRLLAALVAVIALVGLVQAVVWIGQPSAPASRRLVGVFVAPVAFVVFCLGAVATRMPGLLW